MEAGPARVEAYASCAQVCYPPFSPDAESRESYGPNNVFRWFELPEASVAQRSAAFSGRGAAATVTLTALPHSAANPTEVFVGSDARRAAQPRHAPLLEPYACLCACECARARARV